MGRLIFGGSIALRPHVADITHASAMFCIAIGFRIVKKMIR
jgi:hypothetical protein